MNNLHAKVSKSFVYYVPAIQRSAYTDLIGLKMTTLIDILYMFMCMDKKLCHSNKLCLSNKRKFLKPSTKFNFTIFAVILTFFAISVTFLHYV